jgi:ribonucleotide monophosphatase NagD (HAD superfamily)
MAKSTYFVDIFGTVLEHKGHDKPDAPHPATPGSVKKLDQLSAEGHKVVLLTHHPESDRTWIVHALHKAGIRYDQLMMDAGKHRHIIDDESPSVHHVKRDAGL